MSFSRRRFLGTTLASASLAAAPRFALAQAYPSQALKWIIYQSAGGLIDTSSRTCIATGLSCQIRCVKT